VSGVSEAPVEVPAPRRARLPRALVVALLLLALYGLLFWIFAVATRHGGLLTPEGAPSPGLLALGLAVLLLRLVVLFVVPPVLVYRLIVRLLGGVGPSARPPPRAP
jgi:hypothetical protein